MAFFFFSSGLDNLDEVLSEEVEGLGLEVA